MKEAFGWIGISLICVLLIGGIIIGGWQAGWWLEEVAANKRAHIYEKSYGAQSAEIEALNEGIAEVARLKVQINLPMTASQRRALTAQESAIITQTCNHAHKITSELPASEATFVAQNC